MSDGTNKAVFLSYASQDAEAAKKICEALRAVGVEVWFDQSELVGGDAWDAKIRKQISECALFVPVISTNTQARLEGYFRIEWKLAAQRTHAMADEKTFLLPVVIDATRDAEAKVPGEFKAVQWTRLAGGEAAEKFCARVKRLLDGEIVAGVADPGRPASARPATTTTKSTRAWLASLALALGAAAALALWQPWRARAKSPAAPASGAGQVVERARILLDQTDVSRAELDLASELLAQAAKNDPTNAEVFAAWARVDCRYLTEYYDVSSSRREAMDRHVKHATSLDPANPQVRLARAAALRNLSGSTAAYREAGVLLEALAKELPNEPKVLEDMGWSAEDVSTAESWWAKQGALPGQAGRAAYNRAMRRIFARDFRTGYAALQESIAHGKSTKAMLWKAYIEVVWLGDLTRAQATMAGVPAEALIEDMPASAAAFVASWSRDYERVLAILRAIPRDFLQSSAGIFASGYFRGLAFSRLGRSAAAESEWQAALAATERRLAEDRNDQEMLVSKAVLLAALGNKSAAEQAWRTERELHGENPYDWPEDDLVASLLSPTEAIARLQKQVRGHLGWTTAAVLRLNPSYDRLRTEPAFAAVQAEADADPRLSPTASNPVPADMHGDKSVAVLAFDNRSDDKDAEYFSDGISEELINALGRVPGLTVKGRTSAFFFKGKNATAQEIGQKLGVNYLVRGSVRQANGKVRITAQLSRAATDEIVWSSEPLEGDLKDVFAVQDKIVGLVAKNLELKLRAKPAERTVNPEAYALRLRGREIFNRGVPADYLKGIQCYKDSLALDRDSALTWAALAVGYNVAAAQGEMPVGSGFQLAHEAANRALALEPDLAQAHYALGMARFIADWDWAQAEASMQRALELSPNNVDVLSTAATVAQTLGHTERGLELSRKAVELDPLAFLPAYSLAKSLFQTGRWTELAKHAERMIAVNPAGRYGYVFLAFSHLLQGHVEAAAHAIEPMKPDLFQLTCLALVRHAQGRTADSDAALHEMEAKFADHGCYQIAEVYAYRQQADRAFAWLEQGYRDRDPGLTWVGYDPFFKNVRTDARWAAFLKKMNIPDSSSK